MKNWLIKRWGGYTADEHMKIVIENELKHVSELARILNIMTNLRARVLFFEVQMKTNNVQ